MGIHPNIIIPDYNNGVMAIPISGNRADERGGGYENAKQDRRDVIPTSEATNC